VNLRMDHYSNKKTLHTKGVLLLTTDIKPLKKEDPMRVTEDLYK